MSIVVAMMFPNGGVIMYGDKRSVTTFGNRIVTRDDYQKIHMLSETVICGITGSGEWCMALVARLSAAHLSNASEMIHFVKSFPFPSFLNDFGSTITLGGIYDNGKPFLWTYTTAGSMTFEQDQISYSVATNPESLTKKCGKYLEEEFDKSKNPNLTLQKLVKFAATLNSQYISEEYDCAVVKYRM